MPIAAIIAIAEALISSGIKLEPVIANLISQHQALSQVNRPDVTDDQLKAILDLIDQLQTHINANAGLATGAPTQLGPQ